MKFRPNALKDTKREIGKAMKNAKSDAQSAFRVKRDEIENGSLFKKQAAKLTPEEVQKAEDVGLLIGGVVLLGFVILCIILIVWWFLWL